MQIVWLWFTGNFFYIRFFFLRRESERKYGFSSISWFVMLFRCIQNSETDWTRIAPNIFAKVFCSINHSYYFMFLIFVTAFRQFDRTPYHPTYLSFLIDILPQIPRTQTEIISNDWLSFARILNFSVKKPKHMQQKQINFDLVFQKKREHHEVQRL